MEAIRKIVEVKEGSVTLQLPKSFTAKHAELIILPSTKESFSKKRKISNLRGQLAKKKEEALDQQLKQLRSEWKSDT